MRAVQAVGLGRVTLYSLALALQLAHYLIRPPGGSTSGDEWIVHGVWAAAFIATAAGPAGMWWFYGRAKHRTAWLFALGPLLATALIAYALLGLRLI